jgi:hypothetical protein
MNQTIDNKRDVTILYAELAKERDDMQTAIDDAKDALIAARTAMSVWERDNGAELESLMELCHDKDQQT